MRITLWLGLLGGLLVLFQQSSAAPGQSDLTALPAAIRSYADSHGFNGTVLVEVRGRVVYENSFGLADRAFNVPASNDTRYRVASITKAMTSVIILQLYQEGKLDLRGSLHTYLPDFRGEGSEQITVQSLLNHTSGLPQFDVAKTYEDGIRLGLPMYERLQSPSVLVESYCTGKLQHPVGAVFEYNNCDYIILGQIIEKLTGVSYEEALHERILKPLGMSDSGIRYQKNIVSKLANSYFRPTPSGPLLNDAPLYNENLFAAGAMYSTGRDLLKFSNALFGGRLLEPATLALMLTPGLQQYADGVWVRSFGPRKVRVVERYGRSSGMNALLACFPEERVTVILLTNTDETNLGDFKDQIARQLIH